MSYVLGDGREAQLSGPRSARPGAVRCLVRGWILESDQTALSHFTGIFLFLSAHPSSQPGGTSPAKPVAASTPSAIALSSPNW